MRIVEPKVYMIAEPMVNYGMVDEYLSSVGATDWVAKHSPMGHSDSEMLAEIAGRLCYKSWEPGLNANVTRVRADSADYLRNIIDVGHGSVLEHAQFTFIFKDVSRVFTHELVRHRVGVAISQESLRYVRLSDLDIRLPEVLEPHRERVVSIVETLEEFQSDMAEEFGLDDAGVPFHYKKEVTSALRRLAPIGLTTDMMWSANIRTLRHVIESRTAVGAEEEIREVFSAIAEMMIEHSPLLFGDYDRGRDGQYIPLRSKV